jgi:hypothetical protein
MQILTRFCLKSSSSPTDGLPVPPADVPTDVLPSITLPTGDVPSPDVSTSTIVLPDVTHTHSDPVQIPALPTGL